MASGWHRPSVPDKDGALTRWQIQTPLVLQRAIKACWDGCGTAAQRELLSEWVTARVMHKPIPVSARRAALFAEWIEERKRDGNKEEERRRSA